MKYVIIISLIFVGLAIWLLQKPIIDLCDVSTCPFCYGEDLCGDFKSDEIKLQFNSLTKIIFNIFSVKNVYFALYGQQNVVLKKLAHRTDLLNLNLNSTNCTRREILKDLHSGKNNKFTLCNGSADVFFQSLPYKDLRNVCTMLHVNVEPILLQLLSKLDNWPVPKLYGFCGRIAVVENAGDSLNSIEHRDWYDRASVAYDILTAARDFTEHHKNFRLYLADVSPDNIVVNDNLEVTFVDLGNVIIKSKNRGGTHAHFSEHFQEENFIFSEEQICRSEISDHNIYAVCKLLLSKYSPWPMMTDGLLHDPPEILVNTYNNLFKNIELCVVSSEKFNRFSLSDAILNDLKMILSNKIV